MSGWILAQIIKVFTGVFKLQSFSVRALLFGTGGMPSSHSAAVMGLCTACAVTEGFASPLFAVTVLLAIVVMIDATGVRQETGKQSRALNQILEELFSDTPDKIEMHFKELIGHTPLQVTAGILIGVANACLMYFFIF